MPATETRRSQLLHEPISPLGQAGWHDVEVAIGLARRNRSCLSRLASGSAVRFGETRQAVCRLAARYPIIASDEKANEARWNENLDALYRERYPGAGHHVGGAIARYFERALSTNARRHGAALSGLNLAAAILGYTTGFWKGGATHLFEQALLWFCLQLIIENEVDASEHRHNEEPWPDRLPRLALTGPLTTASIGLVLCLVFA